MVEVEAEEAETYRLCCQRGGGWVAEKVFIMIDVLEQ